MKTKFHAASEPIRKLKNLQKAFAQFFNHGDRKYSPPLLAGGCLRDDYMGKSHLIQDYDIFLPDISGFAELGTTAAYALSSPAEELIETIIDKVFPHNDGVELLFDNEYQTLEEQHEEKSDTKQGSHDQISMVWEVDEGMETYQLIFTKNPPIEHVMKYFDLGFCKAYCDGKKIRYTDEFLYDVKHKTMTIVGQEMSKEQVEHTVYYHADKLLDRYQDFKLVIPPAYKKIMETPNV